MTKTRLGAIGVLALVGGVGCALSHPRTERDGAVPFDDAGQRDGGRSDAGSDACPAGLEVCNGIDDDCDGVTDEGDSLCPAGPQSTASCVEGDCVVSCEPGFGDCNGDTSDGCESPLDARAHCGTCETTCPLTANCVEDACVRERIVDLEVDTRHACVLLESGRALCWGGNEEGRVGAGSSEPPVHDEPVEVVGLSDAVDLSIGIASSCALRRDGHVLCWGAANGVGLLGHGSWASSAVPVEVVGIDDALEVGVANDHACVRRSDATVWCWGNNRGNFGQTTPGRSNTPRLVPQVAGAERLFVVLGGVCAQLADGFLWCWGDGLMRAVPLSFPPIPQSTGIHRPLRVSTRTLAICWIDDLGLSHCAGWDDGRGRLGGGGSLPEGVTAIDLDGGAGLSAVATADGRVFGWGRAEWPFWPTPALSPTLLAFTDATRVGAGDEVVCAQIGESSVRCLGENAFGQLGDGTGIDSREPVAPIGFE